jgi:hypothetical protein
MNASGEAWKFQENLRKPLLASSPWQHRLDRNIAEWYSTKEDVIGHRKDGKIASVCSRLESA